MDRIEKMSKMSRVVCEICFSSKALRSDVQKLGVNFNDGTKTLDAMRLLGLEITIDQLSIADSLLWYSHVLRSNKNYVMRKAQDSNVIGTMKKCLQKEPGQMQ